MNRKIGLINPRFDSTPDRIMEALMKGLPLCFGFRSYAGWGRLQELENIPFGIEEIRHSVRQNESDPFRFVVLVSTNEIECPKGILPGDYELIFELKGDNTGCEAEVPEEMLDPNHFVIIG